MGSSKLSLVSAYDLMRANGFLFDQCQLCNVLLRVSTLECWPGSSGGLTRWTISRYAKMSPRHNESLNLNLDA